MSIQTVCQRLNRVHRRLQTGPNLNSKAGITEMLEVVVVFPVMAFIIFAMVYLCRGWYVRAAIEDAAAAGGRWAVTSLSGTQGCTQARQAISDVMSKYHLDPAGVKFNVTLDTGGGATWGRKAKAIVTVQYGIDQSQIALTGKRWGDLTVRTRLDVPVDAFNNRWANGWEVCH